jgi:hypothetical protein
MWSTLQVIKKKDVRNENKKKTVNYLFFQWHTHKEIYT